MSSFLFCFLRPDPRKHAVNQWRHYLICQRNGCGYLDVSGPEPACTCDPTIEYFISFKDANKKKALEEKEAQIQAKWEAEPEEVSIDDDRINKDIYADTEEGEKGEVVSQVEERSVS